MLPNRFLDLFGHIDQVSSYNIKCDIYEENNVYYIEADIPGFKKDEIKVSFDQGNITINANKKIDVNYDNKKYLRHERRYDKLSRSFYLGDVDEHRIEAKYNDGTLTIVAPKKELNNYKKTIEIK